MINYHKKNDYLPCEFIYGGDTTIDGVFRKKDIKIFINDIKEDKNSKLVINQISHEHYISYENAVYKHYASGGEEEDDSYTRTVFKKNLIIINEIK